MKTIQLNTNETKVLTSLYNQTMDCTGGEFGFTSDADKCGFNKNEFAGYVSSLQTKGCFEYLEPLEHMKNVAQYALTEEAIKAAGLGIEEQDTFDNLMERANKLYEQSAEEDRIAQDYYRLITKPTRYVSKSVAQDLYSEHSQYAAELLSAADLLQEKATKLISNIQENVKTKRIMKKQTTPTTAEVAATEAKITAGQTRIFTKDTIIGEKTYKAGVKFTIESIKFCVMQIRIGKANVKANLNLVKSWASQDVKNVTPAS